MLKHSVSPCCLLDKVKVLDLAFQASYKLSTHRRVHTRFSDIMSTFAQGYCFPLKAIGGFPATFYWVPQPKGRTRVSCTL